MTQVTPEQLFQIIGRQQVQIEELTRVNGLLRQANQQARETIEGLTQPEQASEEEQADDPGSV